MHDKSELVSLLSYVPVQFPTGSCSQTPLGVALVQVCFAVKMPLCEDYVVVKEEVVYKPFGHRALWVCG